MKKHYISANHFILDPEVQSCDTTSKQPIEGAIDPATVLTVLGPIIVDFLRSDEGTDALEAQDVDGFFEGLVDYMKNHKADIFEAALQIALGYLGTK